MLVRPALPEDAAAACDVLRRSITELCEADHKNDEAFLARWLANKTPENVLEWIQRSYVFIAEDNGRVVGVAALTGAAYVALNYVAPEARFKGVSKALLREVERKAAELGFDACTLESTKTAERFYQDSGYRFEAGEQQHVMRKMLKVPPSSSGA